MAGFNLFCLVNNWDRGRMHTCIYLGISGLYDNDAAQHKVLDKSAKMTI